MSQGHTPRPATTTCILRGHIATRLSNYDVDVLIIIVILKSSEVSTKFSGT